MASEDVLAPMAFEAEVIHWRGPSPFFFAPVPPAEAARIRRAAKLVSYGWGVIPVEVEIGGVLFRTSLFPKDETYLVPIKADVRRRANVTAGDVISIEMAMRPPEGR